MHFQIILWYFFWIFKILIPFSAKKPVFLGLKWWKSISISYCPQFSFNRPQIWTQPAFLNYTDNWIGYKTLEAEFWIFPPNFSRAFQSKKSFIKVFFYFVGALKFFWGKNSKFRFRSFSANLVACIIQQTTSGSMWSITRQMGTVKNQNGDNSRWIFSEKPLNDCKSWTESRNDLIFFGFGREIDW